MKDRREAYLERGSGWSAMVKRAWPLAVMLLLLFTGGRLLADGGSTVTSMTLYFPAVGREAATSPAGHHPLSTSWRLFWQQYGSPILLVLALGAWLALHYSPRRGE